MNEARAREILGYRIQPDDSLRPFHGESGACDVAWKPGGTDCYIHDSMGVTADELEAIAWWMRNKGKP